jgi:fructosamine-3-kinase
MNGDWKQIECAINQVSSKAILFKSMVSVSGGCINQCWKVTDSNNKHWFIKTNKLSLIDMFIAEAEGLDEIAQSQSIRTPRTICHGTTENISYLALEYIDLKPLSNQMEAGKQLALMHQKTQQHPQACFGWKRDNTIGSTPQSNRQHNNWISFWRNERLLYQLSLALKKGYPHKAYDQGIELAENLDSFFSHTVQPSLLHGDLWSGNCASDSQGNPVVFDPAVYFGDRETDIAMTELFGGFDQNFYSAYKERYPLEQGYKTRKILYNLYHILNHYHLFGGSYASQAECMTQALLAEI